MSIVIDLKPPYLVFLGDVEDHAYAKTAYGLAQWAADKCIAQLRYAGCDIDAGLPDMTVQQAVAAGAKSLVIGSAPVGGAIQENWLPTLLEAINAGMDIVSGLHTKLSNYPALVEAAKSSGARLIDVRIPPEELPIGNGAKRTGLRLLTVGTDCSVGKKYTALAIQQALSAKGISSDFRATGQTGIMIAGSGLPIDAVVSDFIAGAAEILSPDNDADHWDIIEGQGSIFQPAYAGVSLGLLHGSQPDAIVVCHDPSREHIIGCPSHSVPDVAQCIEANLQLGRLTNPAIRCVGVSVNTSGVEPEDRQALLDQLAAETNVPCLDPLVDGVEPFIALMLGTAKASRAGQEVLV